KDKDTAPKEEPKAAAASKDEPKQMTDDLDLGPGVVVTPGYEVPERAAGGGPTFSDRRINVRENPEHAAQQARARLTAEPEDVEIASEAQKARTSEAPDKK